MLAKVRQAVVWCRGREMEVEDYQLSAADIAAAGKELGWADREFLLLVELAEELGFIETTEDDLRLVEDVDNWTDDDVVEKWDRALEFVLV